MTDQTERQERLTQSALRGGDARQLLDHPLMASMFKEAEARAMDALLATAATDKEEREALIVTVRVLRALPKSLQQAADSGAFDAKQLAEIVKDKTNA